MLFQAGRRRKEHLRAGNTSEKVGEETFTFSLDGLSNHDFAALGFIFPWYFIVLRAVQISRAPLKSDLIFCVHNKVKHLLPGKFMQGLLVISLAFVYYYSVQYALGTTKFLVIIYNWSAYGNTALRKKNTLCIKSRVANSIYWDRYHRPAIVEGCL